MHCTTPPHTSATLTFEAEASNSNTSYLNTSAQQQRQRYPPPFHLLNRACIEVRSHHTRSMGPAPHLLVVHVCMKNTCNVCVCVNRLSASPTVSVRSVTYLCRVRGEARTHLCLKALSQIALLLLLELILMVVAQLLYLTFGIRRTRHLSAIKPKSKREGLS